MARMPNFEADIKRELQLAEHAIFGHHGTSQTPAQPPVTVKTTAPAAHPTEEDMANNLVGDAITALSDVSSRLSALAGNPVVDSLLAAEHVPPEAFDLVVKTIDGLEELYRPDTAAPAPAAAAPATV